MEIKISKQVEDILNIEFPCFVRYGNEYWKILNETNMIVVNDYDFHTGIKIQSFNHGNPFSLDEYEFIEEKEFDEVSNRVLDILNKKLNNGLFKK